MRQLTWIICFAALPGAATGESRPLPPIESVRRGVAERDASIRNVAFHATFQGRWRQLSQIASSPFVQRIQVFDALLDTAAGPQAVAGRARLDLMESPEVLTPAPAPTTVTGGYHSITTRGGGEVRRLGDAVDSDGQKTELGRISREGGFSWLAQPADLLGLCAWSPIHVLSSPEVAVEGWERIDGDDALKIAYRSAPDPSYGRRAEGAVWLFPDRDYAVARAEQSVRLEPDSALKLIKRVSAEGFQSIDGVWMPSRASYEFFDFFADGQYGLIREVHAEFSDWRINRPVTDRDFRVEFPDGIMISDRVRGVSYRKGRINDQSVAQHARKARSMAEVPVPVAEEGGSSRSWMKAIWVGAAAAGMMLVALVVLLRKRIR